MNDSPYINFSYLDFINIYPEFSSTVAETAFDYRVYTVADGVFANNVTNPASAAGTKSFTAMFALMCAHISQLSFGSESTPANRLVGRVYSASEGSVSLDIEMPAGNKSSDLRTWLYQTQYGATFWNMTSKYRLGFYGNQPGRRFSTR